MHEIQIARFAIDILLMLGIIYMATRILRTSAGANGARIAELEGGLRRILSEAEHSTKDIDSLLSRRRQDLEQLLFDVEAAEGRVSREVRRAEEQRQLIDRDLRKATIKTAAAATIRPRAKLEQEIEKVVVSAPSETEEAPITWSNVNIYGEPIETSTENAAPQPQASSKMAMTDLKRVVESARKVMETSSAVINQPNARTLRTPEPTETRLSSQLAPPGQKLGVLGMKMKRQVQVL